MKISMVSVCIVFWFPYQIVYIAVMPTIINSINLSKDLVLQRPGPCQVGLLRLGKKKKL